MSAPADRPQRTAWSRNVAAPLRAFVGTEVGGAVALLAGALAALLWANSPWEGSYASFWGTELTLRLADGSFGGDLHWWVNDGLMAIFFFVIGLEVRRELDAGELRDRRRVAVPVLAAVGGMLVPVAIFLAVAGGTDSAHAWGIVMPTDTAFALGVLALAGRRCPGRLRLFVLTLVIADDIGALLVIALAYTDSVSLPALLLAAGLFALLVALRRSRMLSRAPLIVLAVAVWAVTAESGVHPTVAGVVLGLSVPGRPPPRERLQRATALARRFREQPTPASAREAWLNLRAAISPNERLQYALHPWSSFLVVPVFALANAGVELHADLLGDAAASPVALGIVAGLVGGKLLGITLASAVAAHPRLGRLPLTVELPSVLGAAAVAGIGFTLSLFIAELALEGETLAHAKIGILTASLVAALLGSGLLRVVGRIPKGVLRRMGLTPAEPLTDLAVPVDPAFDHVRGAPEAPVTLVEYGDYECPYCGRAEEVVRGLLGEFETELRYVWRHLPLSDVHPRAQLAAEAAEAAAAQGAFWPLHERLLETQELDPEDLERHAAELGLDAERLREELRTRRRAPRVAEHVDGADASEVTGTPTFFVNGRRHEGAYDAATLSRLVREALAAASSAQPQPRS